MTTSQIRAAEIVLKKLVPDLSHQERVELPQSPKEMSDQEIMAEIAAAREARGKSAPDADQPTVQ